MPCTSHLKHCHAVQLDEEGKPIAASNQAGADSDSSSDEGSDSDEEDGQVPAAEAQVAAQTAIDKAAAALRSATEAAQANDDGSGSSSEEDDEDGAAAGAEAAAAAAVPPRQRIAARLSHVPAQNGMAEPAATAGAEEESQEEESDDDESDSESDLEAAGAENGNGGAGNDVPNGKRKAPDSAEQPEAKKCVIVHMGVQTMQDSGPSLLLQAPPVVDTCLGAVLLQL